MQSHVAAIVSAVCLTLIASNAPVRAAESDPSVAQIYEAARSGHLEQAQRMIDRVLHDHPNSAKAHYVQAELYAREGKLELARSALARAEQLRPGLPDENPRSVETLKAKLGVVDTSGGIAAPAKSPVDKPADGPAASRIPLATEGETLVVPVVINGAIKLNFTVDSGAADVSIPADVLSTLMRTATVKRADISGSPKEPSAGSESYESKTFVIRSLKVGDVEVADVEAKVAPTNAPLLLGQSFLKRFKSWSVDNTARVLILQR